MIEVDLVHFIVSSCPVTHYCKLFTIFNLMFCITTESYVNIFHFIYLFHERVQTLFAIHTLRKYVSSMKQLYIWLTSVDSQLFEN